MRTTFAALLLAASPAVADGIELTLSWQDSLTIDGTRYTCNDRSRAGVQLSPGDRVAAGIYRLACAKRGDERPETGVSLSSAVDTMCLSQLNQSISGRVPAKDVTLWADACRTPPLDRRCQVVSSKPDNACFAALDQLISGSFPNDQVAVVQRACNRIEATCTPRGTRKVSSSVDMACVGQLYTRTTGKPSAATIATWLDTCRAQAVARCTVVGAKFNGTCYQTAYQYISGRPSVVEAADIARACTTYDLACE